MLKSGPRIPLLIFCLLILICFHSQKAHAACSTYKGRAVINEVHRQGNTSRFVEVKLLDTTIPSSVFNSWTVRICNSGNQCTGSIPLSNGNQTGLPYIVVGIDLISNQNFIDLSGGVSVILRDGSGNTIDYLSVGGYLGQRDASCTPAYDWDHPTTNSHTILRSPDGTGDWALSGPGGSGAPSTGDPNDNQPAPDGGTLPNLDVDNVTVGKGLPTVFTLSLPDGPRSYNVQVDYQTMNGTAVAGSDYVAQAGVASIPAGLASTTVTVDTLPNYASGEVYFYLFLSNPVNANLVNHFGIGTINDSVPPADHFTLQHGGHAINCLAHPVTITARDTLGNPVTSYTGTISLSTTTGHGTWSKGGGAGGTLNDPSPDDGAATYTFSAGDNGTVVLNLYDVHAETVNIRVSDGGIADDNTEGLLTFRPFGFLVTPNPAGTQVAGKPFDLTLTAAGQTPAQPQCGVIKEYDGGKSLKIWSAKVDPATGGPAVYVNGTAIAGSAGAASNQTVNFIQGVATVAVNYGDAGKIGLYVRDDAGIGAPPNDPALGDEVIGGVIPFVVRPFGFHVAASGNPSAPDHSGPVFKRAGEVFSVQVTAKSWAAVDDGNGDGYPDPGVDLSDNGTTSRFGHEGAGATALLSAALLQPAGGTEGNLSGTLTASFSGGMGTVTDLSYSEVGIMELTARTADYLGGGAEVRGSSGKVGRFIPHHFAISNTAVVNRSTIPACTSIFTYMGETFRITFDLEAQAAGNTPTLNYSGDFAKLDPTDSAQMKFGASDSSMDLSSRLDKLVTGSFVNGKAALQADLVLQRLQPPLGPDGPYESLEVGISPRDGDGVVLGTPDLSLDGGPVTHGRIGQTRVRFGRIRMQNAFGPELFDLPVPLRAEYYDATNDYYPVSVDDTCTDLTLAISDVSPGDTLEATTETCVWDTGSPGLSAIGCSNPAPAGKGYSEPPASGDFNLYLKASGAGNAGGADLTALVPSWLRFDWNGTDEGGDGNFYDDNPTARVTFGIFKGNPRMIYLRETFR